ncbi:MAG: flagellar brake protein [Methylobacter tundripaludum]|nr:flagellar brake protein [Methylobacter tundripaludum]
MNDISSFAIQNTKQIISHLSLMVKNKCLLSARFGTNNESYITALLGIDEKNNTLILDYGPKEDLNQRILNAGKISFDADYTGIKVSFVGTGLKKITHKGEPAFSMPIPKSLFWMQRREFFRIKSPRSKGSYCQLALDEQKTVNLILYDISLTGFSLLNTSAEISDLMLPGTQFEQCKLVLSETGEDAISFKVCSKLIINPEKIDSLKIQKIGCVFTKITPVFESTVQRYINQLQRESIQKKSERA